MVLKNPIEHGSQDLINICKIKDMSEGLLTTTYISKLRINI
jgi:hypothetical protein